ncbi:beta-L-arabinofuranosidase domain-containing protein [Thermosipho sp. (in: thermotogales)]|jgi:hypothetical protein|uniref:glycoside hydrolase family 127 protein n=1 Tax=Thermosipho sp. (in: thermotogales) TaxID=1968895 RepID=UPI00257CAA21|nr:beta-L-arabinofuranosidase domain-containing protein [Thermosipho sp. (in: thermotogales)]MBZ4649406.1 hypothetical protein [Thermosipho sp. (in: thermotogales)]
MPNILNVSQSPYAKLKTTPINSVKVKGFMGDYLTILLNTTLPSQYELLENTGRLDNFRIASGKLKGTYKTYFPFDDTDVYKWSEAVSYALANKELPEMEKILDNVIEEVKSAQDEDGYIGTYLSGERKKERWTNLAWNHELYNAGHLIQAAVAHKRDTGKIELFEVAKRFAEHIYSTFGPGKKEGAPGHPEVEMALVELYRETGDRKYLEMAKYFISARGKGLASVLKNPGPEYFIDHKPFVELEEITGHAVRALYLCSGATDLYLETGNEQLWQVLNRLWGNFVSKKMYITGGAGSRHDWESFGEEYELPNRRSYAESCAAIANFMWNFRMLLATGERKYADLMEQVLYNGLLAGISLDGKHYFYFDPLEDLGKTRRQKWFDCACCPPNLARFIASFPGYIYTVSDEGIQVHFYEKSSADLSFKSSPVKIVQETDYPLDKHVYLIVETVIEVPFSIFLRIPGWTSDFSIKIDGKESPVRTQNGYLELNHHWKGKHTIEFTLKMTPELMEAHPFVRDNLEKVAVKKGPIIYCAEQVDNPDFHVWTLAVDPESLKEEKGQIFNRTVVFLKGEGKAMEFSEWEGKLYRKLSKTNEISTSFTLVPYYAWANREPGPMSVWLKKT